jgi:hypothetical protein
MTATVITTGSKFGGNLTSVYSQDYSDSATSTVQASGDNDITGSFTNTTTTTDASSLTEVGSAGTNYTLVENDTTNTTITSTGDAVTGSDTSTESASSVSTSQETGSDGLGGSFDLTKTVVSSESQTTTANDISGGYTRSGSSDSTSTTQETNTNTVGGSTFTETITDTATTTETSNSLTGGYTRGTTDTTTTTDTDTGSNAAGSFSVSESSSQTATATQTGNSITSAYTLTQSANNSYSMTETGSNFTLTETGATDSTTQETGNTIDGTYGRTVTGTDNYTMVETGTNTGGSFSETVSGVDNYTLTESGNPDNGTYLRTIMVVGVYARTDDGPGATLPSDSGTITSTLTETADTLSGVFSQSGNSQGRYSLLEHFIDVSNTGNGNTPGNMNFYPFGEPFVDPNEWVWPWDPEANWVWPWHPEADRGFNLDANRVFGGLRAVGGVAEIVTGVATCFIPEPTNLSRAWGAATIIHGADNAIAGGLQRITGTPTMGLTEFLLYKGFRCCGMEADNAALAASLTDAGISTVLTFGAAFFRVANAGPAAAGVMANAAPPAGRGGAAAVAVVEGPVRARAAVPNVGPPVVAGGPHAAEAIVRGGGGGGQQRGPAGGHLNASDDEIARHAIERNHFPGRTQEQVRQLVSEVRDHAQNIHTSSNGQTIYRRGDTILIENPARGEGTIFQPTRPALEYFRDWVRNNP